MNTSSTRIELTWNLRTSTAPTEQQRARLTARLATRLDARGQLRLVASTSRSQFRNREEVTERLRALLAEALVIPKTRRPTKPSRAVKAARLDAKRRRASVKRERRGRNRDEE